MLIKLLEVLKKLASGWGFSNDCQKTREQASVIISVTVVSTENKMVIAATTGVNYARFT